MKDNGNPLMNRWRRVDVILYPQSDRHLYVQTQRGTGLQTDDAISMNLLDSFAQRMQTLPPFFVYEMTKERLWTATQRGSTAVDVLSFLRRYVKGTLPVEMQQFVVNSMNTKDSLELKPHGDGFRLSGRKDTMTNVFNQSDFQSYRRKSFRSNHPYVDVSHRERAQLCANLHRAGIHVVETPATESQCALKHPIQLQDGVSLRQYQQRAVQAFTAYESGSGILVLPCGSGKTVVGIGVLEQLQSRTLILVPNESAAAQWLNHLQTWTNVQRGDIGIDDGKSALSPITITTYQRLTARRRNGDFHQLARYTTKAWGLVIYDEVHLLPAPLFRLSASLQANRRLGLSATLVREDGRTADVYGLVGPVLYHAHTADLAECGFLSTIRCLEVRVALGQGTALHYRQASRQMKHRVAADNSEKLDVVMRLCRHHRADQVLVMGHYTQFLELIAQRLDAPMLSGATPKPDRLRVYDRFRRGEIPVLVLSRIANVAIDLPNADVAIQVSGLFGSRQEEAQRIGRLLRPKKHGGIFYSLVSEDTVEEKTARHRQGYLVEQGFAYDTFHAADVLSEGTISIEIE